MTKRQPIPLYGSRITGPANGPYIEGKGPSTTPAANNPSQQPAAVHHPRMAGAENSAEQLRPRFTPLTELAGFGASSAERLTAAGVRIGIYGGVAGVSFDDTTKAKLVLAAR